MTDENTNRSIPSTGFNRMSCGKSLDLGIGAGDHGAEDTQA